jgi:hypothetical protein
MRVATTTTPATPPPGPPDQDLVGYLVICTLVFAAGASLMALLLGTGLGAL